MTFQKRRLDISISLGGSGTFDGSNNQTNLTGYRAHAQIQQAGGVSDGVLDLTIWGMKQSMMNQLSTLGMKLNLVTKNSITVTAGNDSDNGAVVFVGQIITAESNYQGQPEVSFHIVAHTGLLSSVVQATPTSYRGSADVATIMASLATQMGMKFENSGVNVKLNNPYFSGSYKTQARQCAKAANINAVIINGTLCIWPKDGSRNGQIPLISPDTGLEGYPTFTAYGIAFSTLFNPSIGFGQKIQMQSSLKPATGQWTVYSLNHDLMAEIPDGRWHSQVLAQNLNRPAKAQ